jgi:hypothetical protein
MADTTKKSWTGVDEIVLPSGYIVKVRKVSMYSLIAAGVFPNELTSIAMQVADKKDGTEKLLTSVTEDPEGLKKFAGMVDILLLEVLVDPVGTMDKDVRTACEITADNQLTGIINLRELDDDDKQYLFIWTQRPRRALRREVEANLDTFRDGAERPAAGSGGEAVRAATEPADRAAEAAQSA